MLIGIHDKETDKTYHVCGGFPSASGKTNLAMMLAPDALGDRYHVSFYGDDIAWLWVDEADGKLYGMNPEYGVFGVAKDTNEVTNPTALHSLDEGTGTIFTNIAYNEKTEEVWWEGRTPQPPADTDGWLDWKGDRIADRAEGDTSPWAHPNSRFTTTLDNVPNIAPDYNAATGVPIDAIIFGGRTRDREPLIRAITDLAEGVYDGLTLGAEATAAAEGVEGQLRYDPMSNRPFMAYGEGDYAAHYLDIVGAAKDQPIFAHVNWFQRDPEDGHFLWPGYRDNLRPLLWLLQLKNGEVKGRQTAVGIIPTEEELDLTGMDTKPEDLDDDPHASTSRAGSRRWASARSTSSVRPPPRGDLGGPPPRGRGAGVRRGLTAPHHRPLTHGPGPARVPGRRCVRWIDPMRAACGPAIASPGPIRQAPTPAEFMLNSTTPPSIRSTAGGGCTAARPPRMREREHQK